MPVNQVSWSHIKSFFKKMVQNLQNVLYFCNKKSIKNRSKEKSYNCTSFGAMSLCTFNPQIGHVGWKLREPIWFETSTPIHARAWREKALAGYNSQQIPTKNDIHKMLIISISLRWKHFAIKSYLYKISTNTHRYSHSLISPTNGSQLSFILSLKNCIMRTLSIVEHCGICINLSVFISQ